MSERLTDEELAYLLYHYADPGDADPDDDLVRRAVREVEALRARVAELEADLMAYYGDPDDHGADCDTCGHWTHVPIQGQCRGCYYDEDPDTGESLEVTP